MPSSHVPRPDAGRWCPDGLGNGTHIPDSNKIIDKIAALPEGKPFVSFEYFPPRTADGVEKLYARIGRMAEQGPLFVDFTWGAGGSTSDLTVELCVNAKAYNGLDVNMHMTCTNQVPEKVDQGLEGALRGGVRNICALRGDPPLGQEKWEATEGGFSCALDLVKYIRKKYGDFFGISFSGYPEGHPDRMKPVAELGRPLSENEKGRVGADKDGVEVVCCDEDYEIELNYLKEKLDAGGEVVITQLFYDVDVFLKFVRDCRAKGIKAPILPGIMIIQNYKGFKRMCGFCKTRVPEDVTAAMEKLQEDDEGAKAYGIEFATKICRVLLESGLVKGLHFYTLNLEKSTFAIMDNLGLLKTAVSIDSKETENTLKGCLVENLPVS